MNVVPLLSRQQQQQQQQHPQQLLEPGLMNLFGQLSGGAAHDAGMMNAIQNVLGQISSVMENDIGSENSSCETFIILVKILQLINMQSCDILIYEI